MTDPEGSAGGNPQDEKKPRTVGDGLAEEEGDPLVKGLRGGTLAAAGHACSTRKPK